MHLLSEEDRERSIRLFTVQSEEDLSGLSDNCAALLIGDSVLVMPVFLGICQFAS